MTTDPRDLLDDDDTEPTHDRSWAAHSLVHHLALQDATASPYAIAAALRDLAQVVEEHAAELGGADWETLALRLHTPPEMDGERLLLWGLPDTDLLRLVVRTRDRG